MEAVADAHAAGRLTATTDGAAAARDADVVVIIVPVMLDDGQQPDYRYMDAAAASIAPGLHEGSLVIFETTLPVGDTRGRYAPRLEAASGLAVDDTLFVAFSPERLLSGHVFQNLATYPKLVGGLGPASTARAAQFYDSVLDAEVVAMSSAEAAEFAKLADTTYRDVNIGLANEFANYAERVGVDILEVIEAANSQPYSHIHQPGIGVGGHCIPVYPHFLLSRAPEMTLVDASRKANDGQVDRAIAALEADLGSLDGVEVLVLGLTYRHGVKELAYSRAIPLIDGLRHRGARVLAHDPLLDDDEIVHLGAVPWAWGDRRPGCPGDRHPDRGPGLRVARPGLVPGPARRLRRPQLAARRRAARGRRLPRRRARERRAPVARRRDRRRVEPIARYPWRVRIVSVVGTRPQLIKAAAMSPVLRARHDEILVDTGQHYDDDLAGAFYRELDLAAPDHALGVGGGSHAEQTAAMLTGLEPILVDRRPDAVLVYGDTNSTLAGALAAAKLGFPVAHVEAGLRSFDRRMPEEINRIVADHLARWLFAPTPTAVANLRAEGIDAGVTLVGDLMQDLAARVGREVALPGGARRGRSPARRGGRHARPRARRVPVRDRPPRGEPRAAEPASVGGDPATGWRARTGRSSWRSIRGPASRSIAPASRWVPTSA